MTNLIGGHFTKNGLKNLPARVILSLNGNGLGSNENHHETITIFRSTTVFPDGETTPDFNSFDPVERNISWDRYGEYWFKSRTEGGGNLKAVWEQNKADYYQIQNEQGGNDPWALQRTVDIERAISRAASKEGFKCCVMNLAGGSPGDFEMWKNIVAPFIVEAWDQGGHIYGRHLYGGDLVNENGSPLIGQPLRIFQEMEHLKSLGYGGGVVLTELGLDGGYGVANYDRFEAQITGFEKALRPYADMFIGFCWWELGDTGFNADYTEHMKAIVPYMEAQPQLPRWEPPIIDLPPIEEDKHLAIVVKIPQDITAVEFAEVTEKILPLRHTIAFSHDDMLSILLDGNDQSFVKVAYPERDREVLGIIEDHGYDWHPLFEEDPPDPPIVEPVIRINKGAIGVDVSGYQGGFDWKTAVKNGVEFAMIRSSDGLLTNKHSNIIGEDGIDIQFFRNIEEATKLGLPWAIYHLLRPHDIEKQALKVIDILEQAKVKGFEPVSALFDDGTWLPEIFSDAEKTSLTSADVFLFHKLITEHFTAGIYTSKYFWDQIVGDASNWWRNVFCWAADYGLNNGITPNRNPYIPTGFEKLQIWQFSDKGGKQLGFDFESLDINSAGPFLESFTPNPQPIPKPKINMGQYFSPGLYNYGDISIKSTNWGQGDIRQQLQRHNGFLFVTKGHEFEKRQISNDVIRFLMDDSPGDGKYYTVESSTGWIPILWSIGDEFERKETATFYYKDSCKPTGEKSTWTNLMKFHDLYKDFQVPSGLILENVAHLHWVLNGVVEEEYFLAPHLGYAGWRNRHGRESWIKEIIPVGHQGNNRFLGNCYHAPFGE